MLQAAQPETVPVDSVRSQGSRSDHRKYQGVGNNGLTINSTNFGDILSGTAGSFSAKTGWDFVTGIGSTLTLSGK